MDPICSFTKEDEKALQDQGTGLFFRQRAYKYNIPRFPFSLSIVMIPMFWMGALFRKESRFADGLRRRSFEQNLEFYPITRRAFNKAKKINQEEIVQLKEELAAKQQKLALLQK